MNNRHKYFLLFISLTALTFNGYGSGVNSLNWTKVLENIRQEFSDVRHLSTSDLAEWLKDGDRVSPMIFDTREKEEYAVSHLRKAQYLNPGSDIEAAFKNIDKTTPIVVYCSVGYRSSIVARELQKLGYSNVYNLEGSIFSWANEGHPVVTGGKPAKYVHPFDSYWSVLLKNEYQYDSNGKGILEEFQDTEHVNHYKIVTFVGGLVFFLIWESFLPFMNLFQRNIKERSRHGIKNLALGAINAFIIAFCFVLMWMWAAEWSNRTGFGLLNWFSLPFWSHAVGAILLFDIFTYWFHRFSHEIAFFWRFHRVHHSDPKMDVTTANRFHVGEIILSSLLRIPAILIFGTKLWELLLYELIMFPIVQFHHANMSLPEWLDKFLRIFIVTPAMHKVHHSRIKPETNSNYTSLLSIWDRIFGSFNLRTDLKEIHYGLDEFDHPEHHDLKGLITTPLVNIRKETNWISTR